jgi:adenosine deaminase
MGLGDIALSDELLRGIPKAELHIHIEGSLDLRKASPQGVRHAEIFFDPQAHTDRGEMREGLGFSRDEFRAVAENSIKASLLSENE